MADANGKGGCGCGLFFCFGFMQQWQGELKMGRESADEERPVTGAQAETLYISM
jgi:hypothetical protein